MATPQLNLRLLWAAAWKKGTPLFQTSTTRRQIHPAMNAKAIFLQKMLAKALIFRILRMSFLIPAVTLILSERSAARSTVASLARGPVRRYKSLLQLRASMGMGQSPKL